MVDLLGLRAIGAELAARIREQLPRVPTDLAHLAEAMSAVFALPDRCGNHRTVVDARAAAVHAVPEAHPKAVGAALGRGVRLQVGLRVARPVELSPLVS